MTKVSGSHIHPLTYLTLTAVTSVLTKYPVNVHYYPFMLPPGSPLHWAVEISCYEAVRALLKLGADPWLPGGVMLVTSATSDPTYWLWSAEGEDYDEEIILGPSAGSCALYLAVKNWDHEAVQLLLDHAPARPEQRFADGIGMLHHLITGDFRPIGVVSRFYNPLVRGCLSARQARIGRTVRLLSEHGFDIDALTPTWSGEKPSTTALMLAIHAAQLDIAEALLDAGARVDVEDSSGRTALLYIHSEYFSPWLSQHEMTKRLEIQAVKLLTSRGARADASVLSQLSITHQEYAVEILLEAGGEKTGEAVTDVYALIRDGGIIANLSRWTMGDGKDGAHEDGRRLCDEALASMIRKHVVPRFRRGMDTGTTGKTLLHHMAFSGKVECASVLINAGFDPNAVALRSFYNPRDRSTELRGQTLLDVALPLRDWPQGRLSNRGAFLVCRCSHC